jgi:hypothetical protein
MKRAAISTVLIGKAASPVKAAVPAKAETRMYDFL